MINRRAFLKVSGLASMLLLVVASPTPARLVGKEPSVEKDGKLYRGTMDGKIFKSEDRGETWKLHTNFGQQYSVWGFSERRNGQVLAHLSYQYRDFELRLAQNEKFWVAA